MAQVQNRRPNKNDILEVACSERPQSTMSRVVFPWNRETESFDINEFNPISTQGRLSPQDIDRVLNQLRNCQNYIPKGPKWCISCLKPIGVALSSILFVMIIQNRNFNHADGNGQLLIVAIFIIVLMGFVTLPDHFYMTQNKKSLEEREREFKAIIERENSTFLQGREVRWTVGRVGSWLALELDYVVRNMQQNTMNTGISFPVYNLGGENPNPFQNNDNINYPQAPLNDGYMVAKPDGRFNY